MRIVAIAFFVIALIGLLDAAYLTAKHYSGTPITCSLIEGCDRVTKSPYAVLFGIPVALLGVAYYALVVFGAGFFLFTQHRPFLTYTMALTPFGFLASLYFIYLQVWVIGALCAYCLISAAASTALFGIECVVYRRI